MAILADRFGGKSIVPLTTTTFDSASDSATRESAAALSSMEANSTPKTLLNNNPDAKPRGPLEDLLGLFNDVMCNGLIPYDLRLDTLLKRLLRNLGLGIDIGLGCLANGILLDQLLGRKPFSFLTAGLGLDGLSFNAQSLLGMMFNAETMAMLSRMGYGGALSPCSINNMQGLLGRQLGFNGLGLNQRLGMMGLLNNRMGNCNSNYYTTTNNNWIVSQVTTAGVINNLSTLDTALAIKYIQTMMANNQYTNTNNAATFAETMYNRSVILGGLKTAVGGEVDPNIESKLQLLTVVKTSTQDSKIISLEAGSTMGVTDNVLKAISNSTYHSNSPSTDLNNIITGLDNLDPNWNKIDGETNFSKVLDNGRITNLAHRVTVSSSSDNTLTIDVNETLSDIQLISILSAVKCLENNLTGSDTVLAKTSSVGSRNQYSDLLNNVGSKTLLNNNPLNEVYNNNSMEQAYCVKKICLV